MGILSLNSNIASLQAQRRLDDASRTESSILERLSAGLRITRASDDAAGLSISEALNSDKRVFSQGIRNLNDGFSLLSVADATVENLSTIVTRLQELAQQAANGTYSTKQRAALDREAQVLSKEYTRIIQSTEFNGRSLFNGTLGGLRLQGGYSVDGSIYSGLGGYIGTGTLGSQTSYNGQGVSASGITNADLNGDGIQDLVSTGTSGGVVITSVRLGRGDGTFGAATAYTEGAGGGVNVALGDFNGDGIMDMVSGGTNGPVGVAFIRLGRGDGSFGTSTSYTMDLDSVQNVTLGDINNDGNLDLVTAGLNGALAGSVTIRLGNGQGSFGAAYSYAAEDQGSADVVLGDLNGDGNLDLVTVGDSSANGGETTIRLGNGNGQFGAATIIASYDATQRRGVSLGDINGDGKLDIISMGLSGEVYLGNGNGTFQSGLTFSGSGIGEVSIELTDLNGDGLLDFVAAGFGDVVYALGRGNGTFDNTVNLTSSSSEYRVTIGDFNGDGVPDIATAGITGGTGSMMVRLGQTTDGIAPLLPITLATSADAKQAISILEQARARLSAQRGIIGAFQSRLTTAIGVLTSTVENYAAANSRIVDADIGQETAQLVSAKIKGQAAAAILAQANTAPALALKLLGISDIKS